MVALSVVKKQLTIDKDDDRVLSACTVAAIRLQARVRVAKFRVSRYESTSFTVPIVQSQQSASGRVSSQAFTAGRYAKVRCLWRN